VMIINVVCFYPLTIDAFCMCSFFEVIEKQIDVVDIMNHYSGFRYSILLPPVSTGLTETL